MTGRALLTALPLAGLFLLAAAAAAQDAPEAPASGGDRARAVAPPAPGLAPRSVVVRAPGSTLTVVAHDGPAVRARVELPAGTPGLSPEPTITSGGGIALVELLPSGPAGARLVVEVPPDVSLSLFGSNGGPITVVGVRGEIEVENSNAGIKLIDVVGPIVASTSNGPIEVRFRGLARGRPMSFLTSNGTIDLTIPPDAAIDLLAQTDFELRSELPLEPRAAGAVERFGPPGSQPGAPRPGLVFRGQLNGGGALFRLWTDNAPIVLRKGD